MSLDCYNRGCFQRYNEEDNNDQACDHHPGFPYFHDAYKIWSCCNKKSIDFTQFLDIKGCKKSAHSNIKPEQPARNVNNIRVEDNNNEILNRPIERQERPSEDTPMGKISFTVSSSLKNLETSEKNETNVNAAMDEVLNVGTMCKNSGCKESYKGPESNGNICVYHTGVPVFHEGMKYWTCCQRKTSDFENFLAQEGCTNGSHLWLRPKQDAGDIDRSKTCRFDWFQTGNDIVINVYGKKPDPKLSLIEANPVKINILIIFGEDKKEFYKEIVLMDIIDVENSRINFLPSKTEIILKKSVQKQWLSLELN